MQRNQSPEHEVEEGNLARPIRHVTGSTPVDPDNECVDARATDPLASDAPLRRQSEWPSSDELESAMLEADPFEMVDGSRSLTGEIAELFGEIEQHSPRDTVPSPPPGLDEPLPGVLPSGSAKAFPSNLKRRQPDR